MKSKKIYNWRVGQLFNSLNTLFLKNISNNSVFFQRSFTKLIDFSLIFKKSTIKIKIYNDNLENRDKSKKKKNKISPRPFEIMYTIEKAQHFLWFQKRIHKYNIIRSCMGSRELIFFNIIWRIIQLSHTRIFYGN